MHFSGSLTQIALVAVAALLGGMILTRLRQPAILGYVCAGIILGPSGFKFVENREGITLLAELGILLLLFLIGLELDIQAFKKQWKISLAAAFLQILISLFLVVVTAKFFGAGLGLSILLGFIGALSSTAVAVKVLESTNELKKQIGRSVLGILIAQDLAFVPMILFVRGFSEEGFSYLTFVKVLISIGFLGFLIFFLSKKGHYKIPFSHYIKGDQDMIPLAALAFCFALSSLSGLLGLSAAYGAFIAGLIMGTSQHQKTMVQATHPIQSILMMVFFLSIGLLLDLKFIYGNWALVLTLLILVSLVKTILNIGILHFLRFSWKEAFLSGAIMAQLGEFSFLLAAIGREINLLDEMGGKLVVALTALSLVFSPLWLGLVRRLKTIRIAPAISLLSFLERVFPSEFAWSRKGFLFFKKKYMPFIDRDE